VEVHNEEGLVGENFLTTFVFLLFDTSIATGKFSTEGVGDLGDVHSVNLRDILLGTILIGECIGILEEDEAVSTFHIHPIHRIRTLHLPITHTPPSRGWISKDIFHITCQTSMT